MDETAVKAGLPLWLKLAYTAYFFVWVPVILHAYGPKNFLWLCNVCNFLLVYGVWRESRLVLSSQLLAVFLTDLVWSIDVIGWALSGSFPFGFAEYMANEELPLAARALSLYHLVMPVMLVFGVRRLGYDARAFFLQALITAIVLPISLTLSPQEWNINWVWGPGFVQTWMPAWTWVALSILGYPLVLYLPVHASVRAWRRLSIR